MLDRIYREKIGAEVSDLLLENGIHLDLLIGDDRAFGRMGGWEAHNEGPASRCLVGCGETPVEAARALVEGTPRIYHAPNLKTSLWAFGEACELLAGAMRRE